MHVAYVFTYIHTIYCLHTLQEMASITKLNKGAGPSARRWGVEGARVVSLCQVT